MDLSMSVSSASFGSNSLIFLNLKHRDMHMQQFYVPFSGGRRSGGQ